MSTEAVGAACGAVLLGLIWIGAVSDNSDHHPPPRKEVKTVAVTPSPVTVTVTPTVTVSPHVPTACFNMVNKAKSLHALSLDMSDTAASITILVEDELVIAVASGDVQAVNEVMGKIKDASIRLGSGSAQYSDAVAELDQLTATCQKGTR